MWKISRGHWNRHQTAERRPRKESTSLPKVSERFPRHFIILIPWGGNKQTAADLKAEEETYKQKWVYATFMSLISAITK